MLVLDQDLKLESQSEYATLIGFYKIGRFVGHEHKKTVYVAVII